MGAVSKDNNGRTSQSITNKKDSSSPHKKQVEWKKTRRSKGTRRSIPRALAPTAEDVPIFRGGCGERAERLRLMPGYLSFWKACEKVLQEYKTMSIMRQNGGALKLVEGVMGKSRRFLKEITYAGSKDVAWELISDKKQKEQIVKTRISNLKTRLAKKQNKTTMPWEAAAANSNAKANPTQATADKHKQVVESAGPEATTQTQRCSRSNDKKNAAKGGAKKTNPDREPKRSSLDSRGTASTATSDSCSTTASTPGTALSNRRKKENDGELVHPSTPLPLHRSIMSLQESYLPTPSTDGSVRSDGSESDASSKKRKVSSFPLTIYSGDLANDTIKTLSYQNVVLSTTVEVSGVDLKDLAHCRDLLDEECLWQLSCVGHHATRGAVARQQRRGTSPAWKFLVPPNPSLRHGSGVVEPKVELFWSLREYLDTNKDEIRVLVDGTKLRSA